MQVPNSVPGSVRPQSSTRAPSSGPAVNTVPSARKAWETTDASVGKPLRDHRISHGSPGAAAKSAPSSPGRPVIQVNPVDDARTYIRLGEAALESARLLVDRGFKPVFVCDSLLAEWDGALARLDGAAVTLRLAGGDGETLAKQIAETRALLSEQKTFFETCVSASPFSRSRLALTKAARWEAAAQAMEASGEQAKTPAVEDLFAQKAAAFREYAQTQRSIAKTARGIEDPTECLAHRHFSRWDRLLHRDREAVEKTIKGWYAETETQMAQAFEAAARAEPRLSVPHGGKKVAKCLRKYLGPLINQRDLPKIENQVLLPVQFKAGQTPPTITVTCRQTPARELTEGLRRGYVTHGIQRANCHDAGQYEHALTLYHSEMLLGDKPLLSVVRHGVHSASAFTRKGIKSLSGQEVAKARQDLGARGLDPMRAEANRRRALESAKAAMCALSEGELARVHRESAGGGVPTVHLTSTSLLTPDALRRYGRGETQKKDERRMWIDQLAAWKALAGRELEMPVPVLDGQGRIQRSEQGAVMTRPVRVKLAIAAFNFPANEFATKWYSKLNVISGMRLASSANNEGMAMLLGTDFRRVTGNPAWEPGGLVGAKLQQLQGQDQQVLRTLARQVAQLYASGGYLGAGKDPYALSKRVVVLSSLLGLAGLINCKSGKDRTSEVEAQARQLALEIHTTGIVPEPHRRHQKVADTQLWHLHQAGGAREVQFANTNHAGTKLGHSTVLAQYGFSKKILSMLFTYQGTSVAVDS